MRVLAEEEAMASPVKLSHIVLQTNRIAAMREWYLAVLGGEVVHENPHLCFLAYDDEHHRIALLNFGPLAKKGEADVGLHHFAFTFASLGELLGSYERLKGQDIAPHWCVNHGPTTSLYYRDPDGNGVELYRDRPKEEWPRAEDGSLKMHTRPLNLAALLAEA